MSWLSQWAHEISQNPTQRADLFKILLDKGLFALIIGLGGLGTAIYLENFKSRLSRQQELAKITFPKIQELLAEAEALYQLGQETLTNLRSDFRVFDDWVSRLHAGDERVEPGRLPRNKGELPFVALSPDLKIPFKQYLLLSTTEDAIIKVLSEEDFFNNPIQYEVGGGFIYCLTNCLSMSKDVRGDTDRHLLRLTMSKTVFSRLKLEARDRYRRRHIRFQLMFMRNAPTNVTKRGEQAYSKALHIIREIDKQIADYPSGQIFRLEGGPDHSAEKVLVDMHAALLSQLDILLRSIR